MEYRLPGAQQFKQEGFLFRDETMDWLEAQLGKAELGHHNSAISRCRFSQAGATGWPRGQTETVENLASDGRILAAHASSPNERIRHTDTFDDPNLPGEMQVTIWSLHHPVLV